MRTCFVIDLDRCIGCRGCQLSCKMEHGVVLGSNRLMIHTVGPTGVYPQLRLYFMPVMCQHCKEPSCVAVCPTGACVKNPEDGVVSIRQDLCVGCKLCQSACPYDVIHMNPSMGVVDKCDTCIEARGAGEQPACIRNCVGEAILFGDLDDPNSPVSRYLAEVSPNCVHTLRDMGNQPTTCYILRQGTWSDALPQQMDTGVGGRSI